MLHPLIPGQFISPQSNNARPHFGLILFLAFVSSHHSIYLDLILLGYLDASNQRRLIFSSTLIFSRRCLLLPAITRHQPHPATTINTSLFRLRYSCIPVGYLLLAWTPGRTGGISRTIVISPQSDNRFISVWYCFWLGGAVALRSPRLDLLFERLAILLLYYIPIAAPSKHCLGKTITRILASI